MKHVLFVAYDFQPCSAVGASIRSVKFVEKLTRYGWHSTVLAAYATEASLSGEIWTDVHRIRSLTPSSRPWEIRPYGWAVALFAKVDELLSRKSYDLIYVSCPPFPQALACVRLKIRYKLPLIVDFRDAWSLDPYQEGGRLKKAVYRYVFPSLERLLLQHTDGLVVNTPSMWRAYHRFYPEMTSRMTMIPNGFSEEDFSTSYTHSSNTMAMQLLYVGRFGIGGRSAAPLLESLGTVVNQGLHIGLSIVGTQPPEVASLVNQLNLEGSVSLEGPISHCDAVKRMYGCDVLVLYQETSSAQIQAVAGKTYEYLRTGKPMLSIAPLGDNQDLVKRFCAHAKVVTSTSTSDICSALRELYSEWAAGRLPRYSKTDLEYLNQYERGALTRKLADVFDKSFTVA